MNWLSKLSSTFTVAPKPAKQVPKAVSQLAQQVEARLKSVPLEDASDGELLAKLPATLRELFQRLFKHPEKLDEKQINWGREVINDYTKPESHYAIGMLWLMLSHTSHAEQAFRQCLKELPLHAAAHNQLGLIKLGQSQFEEAILEFSQASSIESNCGRYWNNLGCAFRATGDLSDAFNCFEKASKFDQELFSIQQNLFGTALLIGNHACAGNVLEFLQSQCAEKIKPLDNWLHLARANLAVALGSIEAARSDFSKLLLSDPFAAEISLGWLADISGDWIQSLEHFQRALAIRPEDHIAQHNVGCILGKLGQIEAAVEMLDKAGPELSKDPSTFFSKTSLLLKRGYWREGWAANEEHLRSRIESGEFHKWSVSGIPRWQGQPLVGKRLVLVGDQGFGDQIQFVRFASSLAEMGAGVIVECDHSLHRLFMSAPGVKHVPANGEYVGDLEFWVPMSAVPGELGIDESSIPKKVPYLFPEASECAHWKAKLDKSAGLRVGIVWSGNPGLGGLSSDNSVAFPHLNKQRSLPLTELSPLWEVDGACFFSLQKHAPSKDELERFSAHHSLIDYSQEWDDFSDTAAFITQLDLIISVDTSVVHLAGALAKPVWILSRFDGCWRWLHNRVESPWYPTARVFHQQKSGEWGTCVAQVADALNLLITKRH